MSIFGPEGCKKDCHDESTPWRGSCECTRDMGGAERDIWWQKYAEAEDLGDGHKMMRVDGGIIWMHLDGARLCYGSVLFDRGEKTQRPVWTVMLDNPLTLEPSLHCTQCGAHGYVVSGQWRPV